MISALEDKDILSHATVWFNLKFYGMTGSQKGKYYKTPHLEGI